MEWQVVLDRHAVRPLDRVRLAVVDHHRQVEVIPLLACAARQQVSGEVIGVQPLHDDDDRHAIVREA